ncbi:MAG: MBL fold metallo-hydrolase, partial [Oscillospiraceae bacterium]
ENKNCVVFDPGGTIDKLTNYLDSNKLNVTYIILTHGHFDHIGAVKQLRDMYVRAKVYIHKGDAPMLYDPDKSESKTFGIRIDNQGHADVEILGNEVINFDGVDIKAIHTPGHTRGGTCYTIGDYIVTGDTLFKLEVGRTDLEGGNYGQLMNSLKILKDLKKDYIVCPGHGDNSTLFFESKHNPYMSKV